MQYAFIRAGILRPEKRKMAILNDVTSVLKPARTTLLLGPPSAGKSTLLKALAGKLAHEGGLKVLHALASAVHCPVGHPAPDSEACPHDEDNVHQVLPTTPCPVAHPALPHRATSWQRSLAVAKYSGPTLLAVLGSSLLFRKVTGKPCHSHGTLRIQML